MADALKYSILATLKLEKDGRPMYHQVHQRIPTTYTESTHQRIVLATNMSAPQEVDLSGVTSAPGADEGVVLFLETDRAIDVAVNSVTALWPLNANGAMLLTGPVEHLYVFNESTTNQAIVELCVAG